MSDPLTDYRRQSSYPRPGEVDPDAQWRASVRWVRTVLAFLLGTASALALGTAVVLAVGAVNVLSPERPARLAPVLLSVPEVRADAAADWASGLETETGATFTARERDELIAVLDDVLASPRIHQELRDLEPVDGRLDGTALAATLASELRAHGAGRSGEVRRVLELSADSLPEQLAEEGSSADAAGAIRSVAMMRRWTLIGAGVLVIPGVIAAAVALAVARRRPLTAVIISSGALLLAVVALAPGRFVLERLPGPLSIPGHVLAAIGELSGQGTLWTLVLAALVPPATWWALRSWRSSQEGATTT